MLIGAGGLLLAVVSAVGILLIATLGAISRASSPALVVSIAQRTFRRRILVGLTLALLAGGITSFIAVAQVGQYL